MSGGPSDEGTSGKKKNPDVEMIDGTPKPIKLKLSPPKAFTGKREDLVIDTGMVYPAGTRIRVPWVQIQIALLVPVAVPVPVSMVPIPATAGFP